MKITPAHDFNDYAGRPAPRASPLIAILTLDATINDNAPAKYRGLDRFEARKAVLADLEAQGLLVEPRTAQADGAALRAHRRRSSSRC